MLNVLKIKLVLFSHFILSYLVPWRRQIRGGAHREKRCAAPRWNNLKYTLTTKKIKFSSHIRKFRVEQLQLRNGFLINEEMREYFPIYEEAVRHI